MPAQDYNINTRDAVVGQVYGLQGSAKVVDSWELVENVDANDTLAYAEPLLRTGARACSNFAGVTADQDVAGFAVRQVHRENTSRPALGNGLYDNEAGYVVGSTVAVLRFGAIQVLATEAVAVGGSVFYEPIGRTYQATATTPTAYQLTNCVYDAAAAAGEVVVVRILTIA
tara:strand:+ start:627 stop:1139 length:513 start_codon:yes stop_codon:yes gene_type:complete